MLHDSTCLVRMLCVCESNLSQALLRLSCGWLLACRTSWRVYTCTIIAFDCALFGQMLLVKSDRVSTSHGGLQAPYAAATVSPSETKACASPAKQGELDPGAFSVVAR